MKTLLLLILFFRTLLILGQNSNTDLIIQGRILNNETNEPIPYADIWNQNSHKGTISDIKGYFKISVQNINDILVVSCIGFKKQTIQLSEKKTFYTIYLKTNIQLLNPVTILPADDSYLFDLFIDCKKNSSTETLDAKTYYEIKSFAGDNQIELLEAYFNADLSGYDISQLTLKTGRFALKKTGNRFFNSLESSRAIILNELFTQNEFFPESPLVLFKSKMKKKFWLLLDQKYLENNIDSVYVIRYLPKDTSGAYFDGKIWINPQKKQILKTTFGCRNCKISPFIPMFSTDTLTDISLYISKTYNEINNKMYFNHIDFTYQFHYKSRISKPYETSYSIRTNAVLHVYEYNSSFFVPMFDFNPQCVRDYDKINAMPYNNFFWENNNEFEMIDHDNKNTLFYKDKDAISNRNWYTDNPCFKKVREAPFITWDEQRILMKDVSNDTAVVSAFSQSLVADKYNLDIKIFMDINTYSDSTNVLTSAVFDPWGTFYYMPVDSSTNCFLNIIFDIYEIHRRNFQKSVQGLENNKDEILHRYEVLIAELEKLKSKFLLEVDRGTNRKEMEKWNQYVIDNLGINNMIIFNLIEK